MLGFRPLFYLMMLTHWSWDKMNTISQTTLSNAFSWMKMLEFRLRFHWSLFLRVQQTKFQHWFRSWLGADQATSHYLNWWWLGYWHIYASLCLNALNQAMPSFRQMNAQNMLPELISTHDLSGRQSWALHWDQGSKDRRKTVGNLLE